MLNGKKTNEYVFLSIVNYKRGNKMCSSVSCGSVQGEARGLWHQVGLITCLIGKVSGSRGRRGCVLYCEGSIMRERERKRERDWNWKAAVEEY